MKLWEGEWGHMFLTTHQYAPMFIALPEAQCIKLMPGSLCIQLSNSLNKQPALFNCNTLSFISMCLWNFPTANNAKECQDIKPFNPWRDIKAARKACGGKLCCKFEYLHNYSSWTIKKKVWSVNWIRLLLIIMEMDSFLRRDEERGSST